MGCCAEASIVSARNGYRQLTEGMSATSGFGTKIAKTGEIPAALTTNLTT
jgi:hypothetical protein